MGNKDSKTNEPSSLEKADAKAGHPPDQYLVNIFNRILTDGNIIQEKDLTAYFGDTIGRRFFHLFPPSSASTKIDLQHFAEKTSPFLTSNAGATTQLFFNRSTDTTTTNEDFHEVIDLCCQAIGIKLVDSDAEFVNNLHSVLVTEGGHEDGMAWICPRHLVPLHQQLQSTFLTAPQTFTLNAQSIPLPESEILSEYQRWFVVSSVPLVYLTHNSFIDTTRSTLVSFVRIVSIKTDECGRHGISQLAFFQHAPEESTGKAVIGWKMLFRSSMDGLSTNRFEKKVFGYTGPTIGFIKLLDGRVFVFGTDVEWRYDTRKFGKSDTFIQQLWPTLKVAESGPQSIYFNISSRGFPKMLTIGNEMSTPSDFTEIDALEVFGCGSDKEIAAQAKQKEWESRQIEKAKKVPLPGHWDDNPDRQILDMAGVGHGSNRNNYGIARD